MTEALAPGTRYPLAEGVTIAVVRAHVEGRGGVVSHDAPRNFFGPRTLSWQLPDGGVIEYAEEHPIDIRWIAASKSPGALETIADLARVCEPEALAWAENVDPLVRMRGLRHLAALGLDREPHSPAFFAALAAGLSDPVEAVRRCAMRAIWIGRWRALREAVETQIPRDPTLKEGLRELAQALAEPLDQPDA